MFTVSNTFDISLEEIEYRLEALTTKQREVLSLLVRGESYQSVTSILSIKRGSIPFLVANAVEHTGAKDRASLLVWYSVSMWHKRHPECSPPGLRTQLQPIGPKFLRLYRNVPEVQP